MQGQYPLVITGTSGGFTYTQAFTLTVDGPPSIKSASATTFTTGQAGTFAVTTGGYPSPALSETGALPMGVSWVDHNNGTATLAGTPASATGGSYPFTITAANGISPNATQNFVLTVRQAASVPADAAAVAEEPNGTVEIAGAGEGAGWHSLGGDAIGTPAVAAIPTISGLYTPLIFAVGTTHALYVRSIGRSWKQLGPSYCYDSPGATVFNGRLYVACDGRSHILYVGSTTVPTNGALPTISSYQNLGGVSERRSSDRCLERRLDVLRLRQQREDSTPGLSPDITWSSWRAASATPQPAPHRSPAASPMSPARAMTATCGS